MCCFNLFGCFCGCRGFWDNDCDFDDRCRHFRCNNDWDDDHDNDRDGCRRRCRRHCERCCW